MKKPLAEKWWFRLLAFVAGTIWFLFLIHRFIHKPLIYTIKSLRGFDERVLINSLICADWAILTGLCALVAIILIIASGRPEKPGGLFKPLHGHPFWAFVLSSILFLFLLLLLPFVLFQMRLGLKPDFQFLFEQTSLIKLTIPLSIVLGISFSDNMVKTDRFRWWNFFFLAKPGYPILAWNAWAGWFPSVYWTIWRPVLLALLCLPPMIATISNPDRFEPFVDQKFDQHLDVDHQRIGDIFSNQIVPLEEETAFFINLQYTLSKFRKIDQQWTPDGHYSMGFLWDEAAFDFQKGVAFVMDGNSRELLKIDLHRFQLVQTIPIPKAQFPENIVGNHLYLEPTGDWLFLADNNGNIVKINTNSNSIEKNGSVFKDTPNMVWRMLGHRKQQELFLMGEKILTAIRFDDLQETRSIQLPDRAIDMALDPVGNRLFISFPFRMEVLIYDAADFRLVGRMDGPEAVRPILIDREHNRIFLGSYSGAVEVRDLSDHHLIKRVLLYPLIRRMAYIPQTDELIVSSGKFRPVAWKVSGRDQKRDMVDWVQQMANALYRSLFRFANKHKKQLEPYLKAI